MDLSKASSEQIQELFSYIDGTEENRRFALLSTEQLQVVLSKLPDHLLKKIPNEKLKELDMSGLSKTSLSELLYHYSDTDAEVKVRFSCVPSTQLQAVLNKLPNHLLKIQYIPNASIQLIDTSTLSQGLVDKLFPSWSKDKIRQEYASNNYSYSSVTINNKTVVKEQRLKSSI